MDGKTEIAQILVPKNTDVIISILGANLSKAIWGEDAEEWKPERWLKPLPESVAAAHLPGVYSSTYTNPILPEFFSVLIQPFYPTRLTFSGGGRSCM